MDKNEHSVPQKAPQDVLDSVLENRSDDDEWTSAAGDVFLPRTF